MPRRKKGTAIHGWVNLHKPVGVTSTQAVGKIRRALNAQKVGHGGTLDPLASGVLPIALGEATKTVNFIQDALKTYRFTVAWGEQRSTDDAEGDVLQSSDNRPSLKDVESVLSHFIGDIEQIPPQFSAIKIEGERAYDIARDGDHADIKSRPVYIESLGILQHEADKTVFDCTCGKGTYVRALARDMGQKLGCFGYISALERTKVGPLTLKDAISLEFFEKMIDNPDQERDLSDVVLPLQTVLDDIPVLAVKDMEATRLKHGNGIALLSRPDLARLEAIGINWKADDKTTALVTYNNRALAMVEINGAKLQPVKVFNL
jgi:tRNA pseudouridine55 synthase